MGRINMFNFSALLLSVTVGLYTGVNFFEPIVVERLRQDGNLRSDMEFLNYDEEGNPIIEEVEAAKELQRLQKKEKLEQKSIAEQVKEIQTEK